MPTQGTTVPKQLSVPTGKTGQIEHSVNFIYKTNTQYVDFVSNSSAAELDWTADLATEHGHAELSHGIQAMELFPCPMAFLSHLLSVRWDWDGCHVRLQSYRSVLELPLEPLKGKSVLRIAPMRTAREAPHHGGEARGNGRKKGTDRVVVPSWDLRRMISHDMMP